MNLRQKWADISISNKILILVGGMAVLVLLELSTVILATRYMTSIRAFITGESHWSKAQKDAVIRLYRYAHSHDIDDYHKFRRDLDVIDGDRIAREEILKSNPDRERAVRGLMAGQLSRSDAESVYRLSRLGLKVSPDVRRLLHSWSQGDEEIEHMRRAATELRDAIAKGVADQKWPGIQSRLFSINADLTKLEKEFAGTLEELSRVFENYIFWVICLVILVVEMTGIWLAWRLNGRIVSGLRAFNEAALKLRSGDMNVTVDIQTRDELGELARSFNLTVVDLKESVLRRARIEYEANIKDMFLANMSHEMRTPLTSIRGFADLLAREELSEEKRKAYLEVIQRAGRDLTDIIDNILDSTDIQAGHYIPMRLKGSPKALIEKVTQKAIEKRARDSVGWEIKSIGEIPDQVLGDFQKFEKIIFNLVDNAFKFTEQGIVRIRYWVTKDALVVDIEDSGIGIANEQWERLFAPFSQADGTLTRRRSGVGLGLSLAHQFASAIGGEVRLHSSQVGYGSIFRATLPIEPIAETGTRPQPTGTEVQSSGGTGSILLIEDSADNQLLLRAYLRREGFDVDLASDGRQGLEMALKGDYDAILLDMQMPSMDGYSVAKELRKRGRRLPIIAITAHVLEADKKKCLEHGCDDFVPKPIDRRQLLTTLRKHLSSLGPAAFECSPQSPT